MNVGVVFPQTEIGTDVGAIRAYAEAVEDLGYDHVLAFDHVIGADPAVHVGWDGYYDVDDAFLEPFVLFGFLAAICRLEVVTGILILPQRQTVLAAKQAASLDVLAEGRLRLGVGLGWNAVEYDALGEDFASRGRRLEVQVDLMRRLWTERSIAFETDPPSRVEGVGIKPLPVQRPIPVWVGGASDRALARAGRIADGWFPMATPGAPESRDELLHGIDVVRRAALAAGRDPAAIGMEGRVGFRGDPDRLADRAATWAELGATHLSVNTMRQGLSTVDEHVEALRRAMEVLATVR
jgi:probable F420-dependent oxidoreductase